VSAFFALLAPLLFLICDFEGAGFCRFGILDHGAQAALTIGNYSRVWEVGARLMLGATQGRERKNRWL